MFEFDLKYVRGLEKKSRELGKEGSCFSRALETLQWLALRRILLVPSPTLLFSSPFAPALHCETSPHKSTAASDLRDS